MAKFEEEFDKKVDIFNVIGNHNSMCCEVDRVKEIFKDWQPQQALPVVPEDVAKLPPFDDMKEYVLDERLLTIREYLNKLDGKSNSDITEAEAWCMIHEDIVYSAMLNGYTVEKPQLFYLKDNLTGMYLYKIMIAYNEGIKGYKWDTPTKKGLGAGNYKFSQAEIDSMETGSYEQIEVVK